MCMKCAKKSQNDVFGHFSSIVVCRLHACNPCNNETSEGSQWPVTLDVLNEPACKFAACRLSSFFLSVVELAACSITVLYVSRG